MADIKTYIQKYLTWREKHKDQELAERKQRVEWYQKKMGSPEKIENFSEKDLHELFENLWALEFWRNKTYKVNKLIEDNGLEKLKKEFKEFLFSNQPIAKRWDDFRKSIKGFGPSSLSEILTLLFPEKFGIMNAKPLAVLPRLGLLTEEEARRVSCGYTSGQDYKHFMEALIKLCQQLRKNGLPGADFIDTDFFVWHLFEHVFKLKYKRDKKEIIKTATVIEPESRHKEIAKITKRIDIKTHNKAEIILLKLGKILGYDTYSPDKSKKAFKENLNDFISLNDIPQFTMPDLLETIKKIDVIWFEDEFPVYCFEVEHTTGVTKGLLRLYQASRLNTKMFVIAPNNVLDKFEKEINKFPFRKIRNQYIFKSYEELSDFYIDAKFYKEFENSFFEKELIK